MKHSVFLFFLCFLISCSEKDPISFTEEDDLQGTWLLIEQYADPGDGSGDFIKVDSDKTIQFFADGSFLGNGSFCTMTFDSKTESNGTYTVTDELTEFSSENYLAPENCDFEGPKVFLHFENGNLILSYQCFEGCAQRYVKTSTN